MSLICSYFNNIDGQYSNFTITPEEALKKTEYDLPRGDIDEIYLYLPAEFERPDRNVRPADKFVGIIHVFFNL